MKETTVLALAFILVTVLILAPVGCQVSRDKLRTEAISKSTDPIATSCALDSTDGNGNSKAICTLKASGR